MKTMKLLPLLLLLTLPAAVQAQFDYTTNNGAIAIEGYTDVGGAVIIPSTINDLPVTSVENSAFFSYAGRRITSIAIPASVTNIENIVFSLCSSLKAIKVDALNPAYGSVDGVLFDKSQTTLIQCPRGKAGSYSVPNSVTNIGKGAFSGCAQLTSITIPDSITSIGGFGYCGSLTSVTIPNSVTSIEGSAFYSCHSLTSVTIGNNVTSIGDFAFFGCTSLTSVTIPNGVTSILDSAFSGCSSLTSVTIPASVTNLGYRAFFSCSSLTSVTIPNSVTSIGSDAFNFCTSLTSVTIPNSVTSIGNYAFGCSSLTAIMVDALNPSYSSADGVLLNKSQTTLIQCPGGKAGNYTIPNCVTNIGWAAFYHCTRLTSVMIPNSVTSIGQQAFNSCTSVTSVAIPNSVASIGDSAFGYCTSLTNVTIPDSITSIGSGVFAYCRPNLINVTIPNSVNNIMDNAFQGCTSLTGIYFKGNAPSVGSSVFLYDTNATIYYLPGTTGWGASFGGLPAVLWKQ